MLFLRLLLFCGFRWEIPQPPQIRLCSVTILAICESHLMHPLMPLAWAYIHMADSQYKKPAFIPFLFPAAFPMKRSVTFPAQCNEQFRDFRHISGEPFLFDDLIEMVDLKILFIPANLAAFISSNYLPLQFSIHCPSTPSFPKNSRSSLSIASRSAFSK